MNPLTFTCEVRYASGTYHARATFSGAKLKCTCTAGFEQAVQHLAGMLHGDLRPVMATYQGPRHSVGEWTAASVQMEFRS